MVQIGSNLRPREYDDFCGYADSLQLTYSGVASLLILRELRRRRLERLRIRHKEFRGAYEHRITGNVEPDVKAAFVSHVSKLGLGLDAAAGIVFRAELRERWLDRAVGRRDESN